ncbi:protein DETOXIFICATION 18-like [Fagus crenata]
MMAETSLSAELKGVKKRMEELTIVEEEANGNPHRAKSAMAVTLKLSVLLAPTVVWRLALVITNGLDSSVTAILVISIIADSVQGVLSGVARGCNWQHLVIEAAVEREPPTEVVAS